MIEASGDRYPTQEIGASWVRGLIAPVRRTP